MSNPSDTLAEFLKKWLDLTPEEQEQQKEVLESKQREFAVWYLEEVRKDGLDLCNTPKPILKVLFSSFEIKAAAESTRVDESSLSSPGVSSEILTPLENSSRATSRHLDLQESPRSTDTSGSSSASLTLPEGPSQHQWHNIPDPRSYHVGLPVLDPHVFMGMVQYPQIPDPFHFQYPIMGPALQLPIVQFPNLSPSPPIRFGTRTRYTKEQIDAMEEAFKSNRVRSKKAESELGERIGLRGVQVRQWIYKRRVMAKKQKKVD